MKYPEGPDDAQADSAGPPPSEARRIAPWECYFRSISDALRLHPDVYPVPGHEDHGDAMVRMMQRARRHTWLHARYEMGWSMFESIRISVRLADVFAAWTRSDAPVLEELGPALETLEQVARSSASVTSELSFVHQLMDVADSTELQLVEMEFALEALRRAEAAQGIARAS